MPSEGLLSINASGAGSVKHVLVKEGENVEAGQALLEISSGMTGAEVGVIGDAIAEELRRQRTLLLSDLSDTQKASEQSLVSAKERADLLRQQLAVVNAQREIRGQQVANARKLIERLRPLLEKGWVGQLEFQQREAQALDSRAQLQSAERERLDVERQLSDAEREVRQLPLADTQHRHEIERRLADVDEALARADSQRTLVVVAPRGGEVSALAVNDGQHVTSGQNLLSLIPAGSVLQAHLWLSSRAVGFVAPGQRVALRYDAYPYQEFGQQYGRVREVTHSAVAAEPSSAPSARSLYRVTVDLESQSLTGLGQRLDLRPNMTLEADILLERRPLIDWLFASPDRTPHKDAASRAVANARAGGGLG